MADQTVMARRAAQNGRTGQTRNRGTAATDPGARTSTVVTGTGPVRRSTAVKMTATQRDSTGHRSMWNDSMNYFTDPKWSQTVSSQR